VGRPQGAEEGFLDDILGRFPVTGMQERVAVQGITVGTKPSLNGRMSLSVGFFVGHGVSISDADCWLKARPKPIRIFYYAVPETRGLRGVWA